MSSAMRFIRWGGETLSLAIWASACGGASGSDAREEAEAQVETIAEAVTAADAGVACTLSVRCPDDTICDLHGRCVAPKYTIDADAGMVTDENTGLVWQRETPSDGYKWEKALAYCDSLSFGGSSAWKAPTANQLLSLLELRPNGKDIDPEAFPDAPDFVWSRTCDTTQDGACSADAGVAYIAYFGAGHMGYDLTTDHNHVRCVR